MIVFLLNTAMTGNLSARSPIYRPIQIHEPLFETDKSHHSHLRDFTEQSHFFWDVYVARSGAVSYHTKDAEQKYKVLNFMQGLWVVEWDKNSGMLHVFEAESFSRNEMINPVDMGWVHYSDLLLWNRCLITDHETKLEVKGLIINQAEFFVGIDPQAVDFGEVYFYNDAELTDKTTRYSSMYQHYFIYKTHYDENLKEVSFLLGSASRLPALNMGLSQTAEKVILGWVPATRTVVWDTRVAIEPNDFSPAVEEMISKNTPPLIFASKTSALDYFNSGVAQMEDVLYMHNHKTADDLLGTWVRPPQLYLLSDENLLKVGTTGPITDLDRKSVV